MSTVSVIVPCYNYARFLEACVRSVLDQEGVDVEVLIIDDCSTDDTPAVGKELAADPHVSFRRHEVNQGHLATYNEGLEWASGDYTVNLSADDVLVAGSLARAARVMDANPAIGFVYGHAIYFESHDALPPARTGAGRVERWAGRDWIAQRCRTATSCISSPEVVMRTTLQHDLGGYRPDLPHAGDLELWLRLAANADVAYLAGVDQAFYRKHPDSMMRSQYADVLVDLAQRRAAFDAVFDRFGTHIDDVAALRGRAHKALARDALWSACRAIDHGQADVAIDGLEAFALDTDPRVRGSAVHWGLRWRRRVGPERARRVRPLLLSALVRRVRARLWWRRWRLHGV